MSEVDLFETIRKNLIAAGKIHRSKPIKNYILSHHKAKRVYGLSVRDPFAKLKYRFVGYYPSKEEGNKVGKQAVQMVKDELNKRGDTNAIEAYLF